MIVKIKLFISPPEQQLLKEWMNGGGLSPSYIKSHGGYRLLIKLERAGLVIREDARI
jgi:hypothetical protein